MPVPAGAYLYVRDTPWPLGNEVEVHLETGDLISFQPATHGLTVLTTLADLLRDRDRRPVAVTPRRQIPSDPGQLWLLSDGWPRRFSFDRSRSAVLRRDIAGLLHVPESELRIRPCRTGLSDLAVRGYPISAALIATSLDIRLVDTGTGLFPYVLDLRPVLLGIEWGANATGYISLSDLAQRLAVRSGGQPEPPPLQNFLRFSPGEVFVVSFEHTPVDFWEDTTFGMPDHRLPDPSGYGPPADSHPSDTGAPGRVASSNARSVQGHWADLPRRPAVWTIRDMVDAFLGVPWQPSPA